MRVWAGAIGLVCVCMRAWAFVVYAIAVSPRIASITAGELSDVSRVQPELSRVMARVKAVKALWLVRQHPDDIARYHAADLLGKVCMRARVCGSRGVAVAMRRARVWHRNRPLESDDLPSVRGTPLGTWFRRLFDCRTIGVQ